MTNSTNSIKFSDVLKIASNKTDYLVVGFAGIPENILFNLAASLILLVIFFVLRKSISHDKTVIMSQARQESIEPLINTSKGSLETTQYEEKRKYFWQITNEDIMNVAGPDALRYLLFQRYLIILSFILIFLCNILILPINMTGNVVSKFSKFDKTTYLNISANSPIIWTHTIIVYVIMIMSAFGIHYGLLHLKTFDKIYKSTCLMIVDIYPHSLNTIKFWKEMINDMYKDADTQPKPKIYLVKNTEKLLVKAIKFDIIQTSFEEYECRVEMKKLDSNKIFIEKYKMYNNSCKLKCSPCCVNNENIIDYSSREYYKNVLSKYNDALSQQCSNFNSATAIGITFLVFDSVSETLDFKMKFKSVRNNSINLYSSKISDAPNATDLIWENLAYVRSTLMFRRMCTILILLIVLIFFTTPTVCLKIFNIIDVETFNISESISKIGLILPTYLLFIFTLLLPNVCYLTIKLWKHKLISNFRQSVMITTSVHLIMMALIFPALGVTSINAVLVYFTLSKHDTDDISWDKVFSFTSSSFFVNYLITNCFIGCCVELLRIPDLLLYFVKIMGSKSSVERRLISEKERFQFNYGKCYAELVCICSIVITYSLICPIITIFGFLYFLFRQFVDRYNLFYEYKALHVSVRKTDKMHRNALFLTFSGTIVQQFFMLLLNYVRKTQQKVLLYIQFSFLIFSIWMGMGFLLYYNYKYGAKIEREERENIDNEYLNYESLHSVVSKIQNPKVVQQLNTMIEKEIDKHLPRNYLGDPPFQYYFKYD